jgi:ubiquinol-cytochrome c reductase cytochrome b subunit
MNILYLFFCILLPFINNSNIRSSIFRSIYKVSFCFFVVDCILLGWIGAKPIEDSYLLIGQAATFFYFLYIFLLIPLLNIIEKKIYKK